MKNVTTYFTLSIIFLFLSMNHGYSQGVSKKSTSMKTPTSTIKQTPQIPTKKKGWLAKQKDKLVDLVEEQSNTVLSRETNRTTSSSTTEKSTTKAEKGVKEWMAEGKIVKEKIFNREPKSKPSPSTEPTESTMQRLPPLPSKTSNYKTSTLSDKEVQYNNGLNGYEIMELVSCEGNKGSQTVELIFKMKHVLVNQSLQCNYKASAVYTEEGKQIDNYSVVIGNRKNYNIVHYDVNMQYKVDIRNILPTCNTLQKVAISFVSKNADGGNGGQKGELSFVDIPITWR